jgi:hypothetical protein
MNPSASCSMAFAPSRSFTFPFSTAQQAASACLRRPPITRLGDWRFDNIWLAGSCAMTFRTRLLIAFAVTVVVAVAFVGAIVSTTTRRAFDQA